MATVTWIYLWFFLLLNVVTVAIAIATLFRREVALSKRVTFSALTLLRACLSVWLGFYLLSLLAAEVIQPIWIMMIYVGFGVAELFLKRVTERHLLGIPQPSFRDFFS